MSAKVDFRNKITQRSLRNTSCDFLDGSSSQTLALVLKRSAALAATVRCHVASNFGALYEHCIVEYNEIVVSVVFERRRDYTLLPGPAPVVCRMLHSFARTQTTVPRSDPENDIWDRSLQDKPHEVNTYLTCKDQTP
jgi:hypothetical protein